MGMGPSSRKESGQFGFQRIARNWYSIRYGTEEYFLRKYPETKIYKLQRIKCPRILKELILDFDRIFRTLRLMKIPEFLEWFKYEAKQKGMDILNF